MHLDPSYGGRTSLGLLAAHLLGSGAAPGGSRSKFAEGLAAYSRSQPSLWRKLQQARLGEYEAKERQRREESQWRQRGREFGLGPGMGWRDPDSGELSLRGGAFAQFPEEQRRLLQGMMMYDPKAGFKAGLEATMPQAPPTGFQRTDAGLEPIPGGPAAVGYLGRKAAATRAPQAPEKLTTAQQRHNAKVREARKTLGKQGYSRERLLELTQSASDRGRPNPEFNPFIRGLATTAADRLYGDDIEHATYVDWLYSLEGEGYPPGYTAPAQPPPPPGPKPDLFSRGTRPSTSVFGYAGPARARARGVGTIPQGIETQPLGGSTAGLSNQALVDLDRAGNLRDLGRSGFIAEPVPLPATARARGRDADDVPLTGKGVVNTLKLRKGRLYRFPALGGKTEFYRWTGRGFEPVK